MNPMDADLLVEVLRHAPDAVAVVDGTQPGGGRILYSNSTLALLLQRPDEWPVGRKLGEIETTGSLGAARVSSAPVSLVCADGTRVGCERFESRLSGDRLVIFYRPVPKLSFESTQALPILAGNNGLARSATLTATLSVGGATDTHVVDQANGCTISKFSNEAPPGIGDELAQYAARALTSTSRAGSGRSIRQPCAAREPKYFQCSAVPSAYSASWGLGSSGVALTTAAPSAVRVSSCRPNRACSAK